MPKENNKMQVDIENLIKQNVNDLLSIKELYSKLEELGEKIAQIKYIDNTLVKKLKKEYEKLQKIILDENIQVKLNNKIEENKTELNNKIEETKNEVSSQLDTNTNEITQFVVTSDDIQSKIDSIPVLLKKKEIVIDRNLVLTKPIKLKDSIKLKGIDGVEITGDNITPFLHSGGGLKNITIENLTFNGTNSFELEGIEVINVKNCKFKNINGVGLGWLKGCNIF